jgi:hypothetical protein
MTQAATGVSEFIISTPAALDLSGAGLAFTTPTMLAGKLKGLAFLRYKPATVKAWFGSSVGAVTVVIKAAGVQVFSQGVNLTTSSGFEQSIDLSGVEGQGTITAEITVDSVSGAAVPFVVIVSVENPLTLIGC